jgi:hypothetical protein
LTIRISRPASTKSAVRRSEAGQSHFQPYSGTVELAAHTELKAKMKSRRYDHFENSPRNRWVTRQTARSPQLFKLTDKLTTSAATYSAASSSGDWSLDPAMPDVAKKRRFAISESQRVLCNFG